MEVFSKSTAESAKNVINITKTVAERQQMRAVSVFYHGMFNFAPYTLPEVVLNKNEITEDSDFYNNLKGFMGENDWICNNIFVNNQQYVNGDIIIVGITDCDNISVGLIQTILIKDKKVYFVIKRYEAVRNWLLYFEAVKPANTISEFVKSNNLIDYKPLIRRGTANAFNFVLHHHVSFDYE